MTLSSTAVERAIAQCTSCWAMGRGHRLNTSIVLAAVHGLSSLFWAVFAVKFFTLSSPSHSVPVPNRPSRLCGRKATQNHLYKLFAGSCNSDQISSWQTCTGKTQMQSVLKLTGWSEDGYKQIRELVMTIILFHIYSCFFYHLGLFATESHSLTS